MKNAKTFFAVLFILTAQLFTSCSPDHDFSTISTKEILTRNQWTVDNYMVQGQNTGMTNYSMIFSSGGTFNVKKDGQIISGSWGSNLNSANEEVINIRLTTSDPSLMELNKSWKILSATTANVVFEVNDAGSVCQLRIKKEY